VNESSAVAAVAVVPNGDMVVRWVDGQLAVFDMWGELVAREHFPDETAASRGGGRRGEGGETKSEHRRGSSATTGSGAGGEVPPIVHQPTPSTTVALLVSPDGRFVILASRWTVRLLWSHSLVVQAIVASTNRAELAVIRAARPPLCPMPADPSVNITNVSLSGDGRILLVAFSDGSARCVSVDLNERARQ
jgi:hypothetical protein